MRRKIKLIPSVLLLVLCLGILGVGIYAAKPASNTVTGTVNVVAAAPEVQIDVYKTSVAEGNRIAPVFDRRTSGNITFNANSLEFIRTAEAVAADGEGATNSLAEANNVSEVAPITVIFRVTNKSSKDVGVYFSRTLMTAQLTGLTASNITTNTTFNSDDYVENTSGYADVVSATLPGYKKVAKNNGTLDLTVTLTLSQLYEEDITVLISNLYINVEEFQSEYVSIADTLIEEQLLVYNNTYGWHIKMGQGKNSLNESIDLIWVPIAMESGETYRGDEIIASTTVGDYSIGKHTSDSSNHIYKYKDITTGVTNIAKNGSNNLLPKGTYTFILLSSSTNTCAFDNLNHTDYSISDIRGYLANSPDFYDNWGINATTDPVYSQIMSQETLTNENIDYNTYGPGDISYAGCTGDKLFLLSAFEVFCQYEYFQTNGGANRICYNLDGDSCEWWLRGYTMQNNYSCIVTTSGGFSSQACDDFRMTHVRPAFKIAL